MNDDGITDAIARANNSVQVLLGNGDGTLKGAVSYSLMAGSGRAIAADVNGDGITDILADNNSLSFEVLLGNGDGTLKAAVSFAGSWGSSMLAADLNGDGVLDVVGGTAAGGTLRVAFGNQDSTGRRNNLVERVDLSSITGARAALDWATRQQVRISQELGALGSTQSRLQTTLSVLNSTRNNYVEAASRITDADVASESATGTRLSILQRTAQSVLAQANLEPQIALRLLGQL